MLISLQAYIGRLQADRMSKRVSFTFSDDEYAAVMKAMGTIIVETGTTISLTEYMKIAIFTCVCHDLEIDKISDLKLKEV